MYELTFANVAGNINHCAQGEIHASANYITAGIDVNYYALSWAVAGTQNDMGAHIADYGFFTNGRSVLWGDGTAGTPEQAIFSGIITLCKQIHGKYPDVAVITVDGNFATPTVYRAVQQVNSELPCQVIVGRGRSSQKYRTPFDRKRILRRGNECHWERSPIHNSTSYVFNSHCWHFRLQTGFLQFPGSQASVALWGDDKQAHAQFAGHILAEKLKSMGENPATGQMEYEWAYAPGEHNDLGDAVVMALVGANLEGGSYESGSDRHEEAGKAEKDAGIIRIPNSRRK